MPKTGETCTKDGKYEGSCEGKTKHTDTAKFDAGDTFTPCSACGGTGQSGGTVMNWTWKSSK